VIKTNPLYHKIYRGDRISSEEALDLFSWDIIDLGKAGNMRRRLAYPKDQVGFIIDRIVNYQPVEAVLDEAMAAAAEDSRTTVNQHQPGIAFRTYKPASDQEEYELLEKLRAYGIEHSNEPGPSLWRAYIPLMLITGLFVLLFIIMMRRLSGAGSPMSFGRSRGRLYAQEDIGLSFDDVAGIDEAVEEIREVVDFLRSP